MATVSIVVPAYNRSSLLKECVESLLAQTYPDIEIIVVDDGSIDDTPEMIKTVADRPDTVKYYYRPHLGACAARNFGLEQAKGEYIGFFDSDDLWPPDYIETMVKRLKAEPDFGAVYSKIKLLVNGEIREQNGVLAKPPYGQITADLFSGEPFILPSSAIFRKDVWSGILWEETLKNRQDFDVLLRISTRTKFMHVADVYAIHRKHNNSISVMAGKDMLDDGPRVMERFYFKLGGNSYVPRGFAFRQISHRYRRFAIRNYKAANRNAAISLLKKALSYYPLDLRIYVNLFQALLLNPRKDRMPDWRLPEPLGLPVKGP